MKKGVVFLTMPLNNPAEGGKNPTTGGLGLNLQLDQK